MRRATMPAIWVTTIRPSGPSTVTRFCSFRSDALSLKAGRKSPAW